MLLICFFVLPSFCLRKYGFLRKESGDRSRVERPQTFDPPPLPVLGNGLVPPSVTWRACALTNFSDQIEQGGHLVGAADSLHGQVGAAKAFNLMQQGAA